MKKVLALDFDGVICDSIDECFLTSYHAYNQKSKIENFEIDQFQKSIVKNFKRNRYLIGPAKDFYFLWKSISYNLNSPGDIKNMYFDLKISDNNGALEFADRFYRIRDQLKYKHFHKWNLLNPFYEQIRNTLIKITDKENLFIVTAKDKKSVIDLLKQNKVNIKNSHIYGREKSLDKREIFHQLTIDHDVDLREIVFVDDNITNAIDVSNIGILSYFATWGYNTKSDKVKALKNNIIPLSQRDMHSIIFKIISHP